MVFGLFKSKEQKEKEAAKKIEAEKKNSKGKKQLII